MGYMEDFKTAVLDALGAGTGYLTSDFAGEYTAKALKKAGEEKTGIKILFRIIFGALGVVGGSATSGFLSLFLMMFGVGAFAGIIVDLFNLAVPGGIGAVTTGMVKKMNRREDIVVHSNKADKIIPIVKW